MINENGSISRDPAAPDVPAFNEFCKAVYGKDNFNIAIVPKTK